MRSIRRTLTGPSVLPKTQRNRGLLLRTCFTTISGTEIHISRKFYADAMNGRRRPFVLAVKYIISITNSEGSMLVSTQAPTTYGM